MDDKEFGISGPAFEKYPRLVKLLTTGSLFPFLLIAIVFVFIGNQNTLSEPLTALFRSYSLVILSFLGGARWGYALVIDADKTSKSQSKIIVFSLLPSLIAFVSIFLGNVNAVALLLIAHCAQGAWDNLSASTNGLPLWYGHIRMISTLLIAASHIAVLCFALIWQ